MEKSSVIDLINKFKAQAKLSEDAANPPSTYWITITNEWGDGFTLIAVPEAGTLWVQYEYSNAPALEIGVWHEGGSITPIQPGENIVSVGYGDLIYYLLANPASDLIKLGYQML